MSERDLTAAIKSEVGKDAVNLALFAELLFGNYVDGVFVLTGAVRLWSGLGPITFRDEQYIGVGDLAAISSIQESADDIKAVRLAMSLSGLSKSLLAACMTEHTQGRPASLWLGFFDANWQLIPDEILLFKGRMDYPDFTKTGETMTITINAESHLIDLERPRVRRYTDADQQELHPGDTGLRFMAGLQNKEVPWSSK